MSFYIDRLALQQRSTRLVCAFLLLFIVLIADSPARSQQNLTGDYIQLPIDAHGNFLTTQGAKFNKLGTGGGTGVDFWVWGDPVYNSTVQANNTVLTNGLGWFSGPTVQNTSSGTTLSAKISGRPVKGLYFERNVRFEKSDVLITISDVFFNEGTADFTRVATLDNTDPDQGIPLSLGYATYNDVITLVAPNDFMFAAVSDTGDKRGLTIGFGWRSATNAFSVLGVNPTGLKNTDPYSVINNAYDPNGAYADVGINLASDFKALPVGQTKSAVWYIVFGGTTTAAINAFTNVADVTPPDTVITGAPTACVPFGSPAVFTWTGTDDRTPATQLRFQYQLDNGAWTPDPAAAITTITLNNVPAGNHVFSVRAVDLAGNVDKTPDSRAFHVDDVPLNISNAAATAVPTGAIFTWTTSKDATSQVDYGLTPSYGTSTTLDTNMVSTHSVSIGGLTSNTTYHYRVRSKDGCGREALSGDATFTTNAPDLQVLPIQGPQGAYTDRAFDLTWTDSNQGQSIATGPWTDRILLSTDNALGGDIVLADFGFSSSLTPGQSAQRTQTISIPRSAAPTDGNYFLIIYTDYGNSVNEGTNEGNNYRIVPLYIARTPVPDLTVTAVQAPDTAFFDQTVTVSWTVKNIGNGSTDASEWYDSVQFRAPDGTISTLATSANVSYLAANDSYVGQATVHLPRGIFGTCALIVSTDIYNNVKEDVENNNSKERPITLNVPPLPDLQVPQIATTTLPTVFAGSDIPVNWTGQNKGNGPTPPGQTSWTDGVYLSKSADLSAPITLATLPHNGEIGRQRFLHRRAAECHAAAQSRWRLLCVRQDRHLRQRLRVRFREQQPERGQKKSIFSPRRPI